VTQDDLLYRFRPRVFAIAAELGTMRAACQAMGIHPSTCYRWKRQLDRHGPEILPQTPAATCATQDRAGDALSHPRLPRRSPALHSASVNRNPYASGLLRSRISQTISGRSRRAGGIR
jgi:transposase-like protein